MSDHDLPLTSDLLGHVSFVLLIAGPVVPGVDQRVLRRRFGCRVEAGEHPREDIGAGVQDFVRLLLLLLEEVVILAAVVVRVPP